MRKFIGLFLYVFILLDFNNATAQISPGPYEIRTDTVRTTKLPDSCIVFISDTLNTLSRAEIRQLLAEGKMRSWNDSSKYNMDRSKTYWYYFKLSNRTGKKIETGLDANSAYARFEVVRSNGSLEILETGSAIPWSKKPEFRQNNIVPIWLDPNEEIEVYYNVRFRPTQDPVEFFVGISQPNLFARDRFRETELNSVSWDTALMNFFSGFFLMASILYFIFFYINREKLFLYFGLVILVLALGDIALYEYFVRLGWNMGYNAPIGSAIFFISFTAFFREYLKTAVFAPRWDKVLLGLTILISVFVFTYLFFPIPQISNVAVPFLVAYLIALVLTPFFLGKALMYEKKFLFYAILPLLITIPIFWALALVIFITGSQDSVRNNFLTSWIIENGNLLIRLTIVWMILSFSRLMVRRFNEQRKRIREQELEKDRREREIEQERIALIEKQKIELENQVKERTAELSRSLEDLKATQAQLIQAEKMASLGEMTAGIAHEIQNPLNFVNNFAEVNTEILEELKNEIGKIVTDDSNREELEAMIQDLSANQDKIRNHGKRADSIVKNMLQHSRTSSSQKEDVDVNTLIDEYVKLSFHGMRAKDKTFNADFNIELDPSIEKASVLAQDFGRVILNLVNNAFYAVTEKKNTAIQEYKPEVTVSTSQKDRMIRIIVSDNGNGISEKIKDKIFQPFFTTKPTGEGTGLGLSISYDIITKGHGGKMWVESKEGEGSSFIIEIPT